MGLDQYIFRVKKLNLEDREYTSEEIENLGYSKAFVDEAADEYDLIEQLIPYTATRQVSCKFINNAKIRKDYNLPDDIHVNMYSSDGIMFGDVLIPLNVVGEKYTVTQTKPCYIWKTEEEAYWRKNYDLQEWIYETLENVQNTGYYLLDAEIINELNETFNENIPDEDPTDEEALFYWEWY